MVGQVWRMLRTWTCMFGYIKIMEIEFVEYNIVIWDRRDAKLGRSNEKLNSGCEQETVNYGLILYSMFTNDPLLER